MIENWIYTHLKTFKYKLFKLTDDEDFKKNGRYLKSATDLAIMYPMLEMSGKFKCVQNVLYKYNKAHPESHNDKNSTKHKTQTKNAICKKTQKISTYILILFLINDGQIYKTLFTKRFNRIFIRYCS